VWVGACSDEVPSSPKARRRHTGPSAVAEAAKDTASGGGRPPRGAGGAGQSGRGADGDRPVLAQVKLLLSVTVKVQTKLPGAA